jgi:hypothetical protein
MILSDYLKETIADQMTIAVNGGDPREAYLRIIAAIESAPVQVGKIDPPKTQTVRVPAACTLPELPVDLRS